MGAFERRAALRRRRGPRDRTRSTVRRRAPADAAIPPVYEN